VILGQEIAMAFQEVKAAYLAAEKAYHDAVMVCRATRKVWMDKGAHLDSPEYKAYVEAYRVRSEAGKAYVAADHALCDF
jgi:hypothetical protein